MKHETVIAHQGKNKDRNARCVIETGLLDLNHKNLAFKQFV
jgi:hypothetical protein